MAFSYTTESKERAVSLAPWLCFPSFLVLRRAVAFWQKKNPAVLKKDKEKIG
jgi:hypothetical protein